MSAPSTSTATSPPLSPYLAPGAVLRGRYEVLREIGRGGYSVVYAARDREVGADVAIKLLVPPPAAAQLARERMRREVQAVRRLTHPNVVAVYDFVDDGAWSFIVMELVDGPDLAVRVRDRGPLAAEQAARLGRDVAAALTAAHQRGILHRDVKPQNILIAADGAARLTDFGSARLDTQATLTQTGALVGTAAYAAPEVVAGRRGDARSDVYALGVTLYYALAGRLPERGQSTSAAPRARDGHRPRVVRADVPQWVDDVVAHATAAEPGERFPSAASLADALAQRDVPVAARRGAHLDLCVVCGAPEPLGLSVCPRCGGTAGEVADTLVLLRRPRSESEADAAHRALGDLLGARAWTPAGRSAARGEKSLLRVPASVAPRVLDRMELRDISARALPASRAWTAIPASYFALLAAVLAAGAAAGNLAAPLILLTTPVMATLLLAAAERSVREPLLSAPPRARRLPKGAELTLLAAFAELPGGAARSLLADVVRLGQELSEALARSGDERRLGDSLEALLAATCAVALELEEVERRLSQLDDERERLAAPSAAWLDELARCERARDSRVQRLLDAMTVLGRLRSQTLGTSTEAADRLADLTHELASEANARDEAAVEVERVLGTKDVTPRT